MKDESRSHPTSGASSGASSQPRKTKPFFSTVDASLLGLGTQMMSEVIAGVLLGYGIDYILGTRNRWIVVGSIAGVVVAMATVLRMAMRPPAGKSTGKSPGAKSPGAKSLGPDADADADADKRDQP